MKIQNFIYSSYYNEYDFQGFSHIFLCLDKMVSKVSVLLFLKIYNGFHKKTQTGSEKG